MANNDTNETATQNSKFVYLNSSQQQLYENSLPNSIQFKKKWLKTIYQKDENRKQYVGCIIWINDLNSVPDYKLSTKKEQCRICINEEETSRFISPCRCKGTSEYVHEECLKMWILEQQGVNRIFNDEISCEICQQRFHYTAEFNNRFDCNSLKRIKLKTKFAWTIEIIILAALIYGSIHIGYRFGLESLATIAIIVIFGIIGIMLIIYITLNFYRAHKVQMIEKWHFYNYGRKSKIRYSTRRVINQFT